MIDDKFPKRDYTPVIGDKDLHLGDLFPDAQIEYASDEEILALMPRGMKNNLYYRTLAQRDKLQKAKRPKQQHRPQLTNLQKNDIDIRCAEYLAKGKHSKEIEDLVRQEFDISRDQARASYKRTKQAITAQKMDEIAYHRNIAIRRLENALNEANEKKDYMGATAIQRELTNLLGLAKPAKQDITVGVRPLAQMTDDEIKTLLNG